jgi:hypothetical protein
MLSETSRAGAGLKLVERELQLMIVGRRQNNTPVVEVFMSYI